MRVLLLGGTAGDVSDIQKRFLGTIKQRLEAGAFERALGLS